MSFTVAGSKLWQSRIAREKTLQESALGQLLAFEQESASHQEGGLIQRPEADVLS